MNKKPAHNFSSLQDDSVRRSLSQLDISEALGSVGTHGMSEKSASSQELNKAAEKFLKEREHSSIEDLDFSGDNSEQITQRSAASAYRRSIASKNVENVLKLSLSGIADTIKNNEAEQSPVSTDGSPHGTLKSENPYNTEKLNSFRSMASSGLAPNNTSYNINDNSGGSKFASITDFFERASYRVMQSDINLNFSSNNMSENRVKYGKALSTHPSSSNLDDPRDSSSPEDPSSGNPVTRFNDSIALFGNSLGFIKPRNPIRQLLHRIISNNYFRLFMTLLILFNWIVLASVSWSPGSRLVSDFGNMWQDYALLFVFIMYTFEFICKVVVFGLYLKPDDTMQNFFSRLKQKFSYKNSSFKNSKKKSRFNATHAPYFDDLLNRFDFIVMLSFWLQFAILPYAPEFSILLKTLSSLRPFRLLNLTPGLSIMTRSLAASGKLLKNVFVFMLFFYIFFGIMGVQFFRGSFARRCVIETVANNGSFTNELATPIRACGSYMDKDGNLLPPLNSGLLSPKGHSCPYPQVCKFIDTKSLSPDGFVSFDNLPSSIMTIFRASTSQGWTRSLDKSIDSEFGFSVIYWIVVMISLFLVLMSMFIAVIAASFSNVHAVYQEKLSKQLKDLEILRQTGTAWTLAERQAPVDDQMRFQEKCRNIIFNPWYRSIKVLLALISLLSLIFQKLSTSTGAFYGFWGVDVFLVLFFVFDIAIRYLAEEKKADFWKSSRKKIDLSLAFITTIIILPGVYGTFAYKYLSIFQAARFYHVAFVFQRISRIFKIAFGNMVDLANATLFFVMVMCIVATVGMQNFGGLYSFLNGEQTDHGTWDSFAGAFIITCQLMVSEDWTYPFHDSLYANRNSLFAIVMTNAFYVVAFLLCHVIIIDLAVAVILENFELSEKEKKYGQVVQLVGNLERRNTKLESSYFSRWNPFRYLPPSPDQLFVSTIPAYLRAKIRRVYFNDFINGYFRSSKHAKDTHKNDSAQAWRWWPFKRKAPAPREIGKSSEIDGSDFSVESTSSKFSATTVNSRTKDNRNKKQLAALVSDKSKAKYGVRNNRNPNLEALNANFEDHGDADSSDFFADRSAAIAEFKEAHPMYDTSYFIFKPENKFRKLSTRLVGTKNSMERKIFGAIIAFFIVASTVFLALNTPISRRNNLINALEVYANQKNLNFTQLDFQNPSPDMVKIMTASEYYSPFFEIGEIVFTVIFSVEFLLKTVADGLILTPNAYLSDGWNVIDFIVLLSMWLSVAVNFVGATGFARIVRIIRALRPIRLVSQFSELKKLLSIVISSLSQVVDSILLLFFVMVPYATYGMVLFRGLFKSCNDETIPNASECVGSFVDPNTGLVIPRAWSNSAPSFDTFFESVVNLFEIMMEEGWLDVFNAATSTDGTVGDQPVGWLYSWYNAFYFIIWIFFGFVILRNLFVGVILQTFMTYDGTALLTREQRRWVDLQKKIKILKPTSKRLPVAQTGFRKWIFDLVKDKNGKFDKFITGTIILNLLIMATEYQTYTVYPNGRMGLAKDIFATPREYFYVAFSLIYTFEAAAKFFGLGYSVWVRNPWHIFDMTVVLGLLPVNIALLSLGQNSEARYNLMQVQKVLLDLVGLRLIHRISILKMLFKTMVASFKSIINILGLLLLVFTVYTLICVEVFGLTKLGTITNENFNFRTFGNGMLTLFRFTTGEAWNQIYRELRVESPFCITNAYTYLLSDCGSTAFGYALIISFQLLVSLIFMSLFVVTIIDNFDFSQQQDLSYSLLTMEDLSKYKKAWAELDPRGTGYIEKSQLNRLLRNCGPRLSVKIYDEEFSPKNLVKNSQAAIDNQERNSGDIDTNLLKQLHPKKKLFDNHGLNLAQLSSNIRRMDFNKVKTMRHQCNFVYHEILSHETPRGLAFEKVLTSLLYQLVDVEKSLKIDQIFMRQQEISQVQERVYREKVLTVFSTIALRKRFKKHFAEKMPDIQKSSKTMESPKLRRRSSASPDSVRKSDSFPRKFSRSRLRDESISIPPIVVEPDNDEQQQTPKITFSRSGETKDINSGLEYPAQDTLNMSGASLLASGLPVNRSVSRSMASNFSGEYLESETEAEIIENLSQSPWLELMQDVIASDGEEYQ